MAPTFSMPRGDDAATAATVLDLRQTIRALRCAVRLLSGPGRTAPARERAVVGQMRRAIRRAEAALKRLPSRWIP